MLLLEAHLPIQILEEEKVSHDFADRSNKWNRQRLHKPRDTFLDFLYEGEEDDGLPIQMQEN